MKKSIFCLGMILASFTTTVIAGNPQTAIEHTISSASVTPLCAAISKGEIEIVKKFVEYGANVNETSNGMTPLMVAARYNHVEIMSFLISKGAQVDARTETGLTALKYAQMSNATEAVDFLKNLKNRVK